MSGEAVRGWLAAHAPDLPLIETHASTATVLEAAAALGVEPGRIAKTLALRIGATLMVVVASGAARLDNARCKTVLGGRPRMLGAEETEAVTGHPIGGVCPFALRTPLPVHLDVSLRRYDLVYPAAGTRNSSVAVAPARLAQLVGADWIEVFGAA